MNTETPAPSGASFTGAGIEPGLQPEAAKPTVPVHRPVETPPPPKASKPSKDKRVAPEGVIIPTMGPQKFIYKVHCRIRRPDLVPGLSKRELRLLIEREVKQIADRDRETKKTWLSAYFNSARTNTVERVIADGIEKNIPVELSWKAQSLVVALLSHKGGVCKTEGTVQLSRTFAKRLKSVDNPEATPPVGPILIIPATRNPGNTTRKAGVASEDTLTLPEVETLLKRLEAEEEQVRVSSTTPNDGNVSYISAESITSHLRKNGDGVYVLAQSQLPPDFDDQRFRWVLERLKKIFPLIILDTGNNTAKVGEIEYMAAYMADVLVFVCYTGMDGSPELMGETMDSYQILPQKGKLSASISVIHGVRPEDSLDNYRRYAELKINEHGHTIGIRDFPYRVETRDGKERTGTLLSIPWDDALYLHRGNDIAQETEDAYLELAFQIALTNGQLKGLDFTTLDRIRSIKKMVAEFDENLLSEHYPTPQAWIAAHERGEIPST